MGQGSKDGGDRVIYPTHTCFDDALDLLVDMLKGEGPGSEKRLRLVHAICEAPDGHHYAHAWIEDISLARVFFVGIINDERHVCTGDAGEYYVEIKLIELRRYTYAEAFVLNRDSGHYGPWVEHYRALCGRNRDECW